MWSALITMLVALPPSPDATPGWSKLAPLPDKEGYAGSYAGVSGGALIVAGGANFPGKKPWEGGTKVWTDAVYALDKPTGAWAVVGKLPGPRGYGVSVTHGGGIVCVGGSDSTKHYADAFRLTWKDDKLTRAAVPPLPEPMANGSGALVGSTLYVAGGIATPDATSTLNKAWAIDLDAADPAWRALPSCPGGGRMLAVAAAVDGAFYLAGGTDLAPGADGKPQRRYLKDAYRYDAAGWKRLAYPPSPSVAAPSPAPTDAGGFFTLGGDDGSQISRPPAEHVGFSKFIWRYDIKADRWADAGRLPAGRVTTPCVVWNGQWVVPSGEATPGVRSPDVWSFRPDVAR